jgi:hypothetical protein
MKLREILQQLNESEFADKQKALRESDDQEFIAPAAQTLAPGAGSGDTGIGVEDEQDEKSDDAAQEQVPTDGETPADAPVVSPTPEQSPTDVPSAAADAPVAPAPQEPDADEQETDETDPEAEQKKQTQQVDESKDDFKSMLFAQLTENVEFKANSIKVKTLMESQGLDADLTEQAVVIFEQAVSEIAKQHVTQIAEYASYVAEQLIVAKINEMESIVESRLNDGIASWVEANQIGIEQGVRVTVAESFMDKLGGVLKEHFVHVPDFKKDLYEENLSEIAKQGELMSESKTEIDNLRNELKDAKKQIFVESYVQGLSMLQKERIKELSKDLIFESEDDFKGKLSILKESISTEKKHVDSSALVEDIQPIVEKQIEQSNAHIDPYVAAISKSMHKF